MKRKIFANLIALVALLIVAQSSLPDLPLNILLAILIIIGGLAILEYAEKDDSDFDKKWREKIGER